MIRSAVVRGKSVPRSSRNELLLFLLLLTSFVAGCSGTKQNSAPDSSAASAPSPSPSSASTSSAAGAAGAPFEGSITVKLFGGGDQPREIRYAIKGTRARTEAPLSAGGTQTGVILMDLSSSTQTMLLP